MSTENLTRSSAASDSDTSLSPSNIPQGLKILSKPRPGYTDQARRDNLQGTVVLRVTFQANAEIGPIQPTKSLKDGLTDQAIEAAKGIRFEPATVNGNPVTTMKQVEYTFSIY